MTVFVFYDCCPGIDLGPIDDQLPHLMEICGCHRFRKSQLPSEDRRDADFVWFDVDIWRDD